MTERKCSLMVVKSNGTRLYGTAAILHMTSINGGFDAWLESFAARIAKTSVQAFIEDQKKPKLRRIQ